MPDPTGEPGPEHAILGEPIMVVDRITQELITQQLKAAIEHLDTIANAIREDGGATNVSLVYVSTVNALAHLDGTLKLLPWVSVQDGRRRAVTPPPPPPRVLGHDPEASG